MTIRKCPDCRKLLREKQMSCMCGWSETAPETINNCDCGKRIHKDGKCFSCLYPAPTREVKDRLRIESQRLLKKLRSGAKL